MAFREYHNGDAWITADENNERNAARGTMVRSGGAITIAASSSEPLLSVDATEVRIAETDHSLGSDTVALPANATAYPRRDLVIAREPPDETSGPSYDVLAGDPISPELLQRLQNPDQPDGARIDGEGLPIHPPESIPQVQPPAATGLRGEATVLAMVYVPPGTADSTDLADEYITDLRREGIGVEGVLRTGDAVEEVESHEGNIDADITGTAQEAREVPELGGYPAGDYSRALEPLSMNLNRTGTQLDHRVSFETPEIRSNPGNGFYHVDVRGFGNYSANDEPVFISADVAAIYSDGGLNVESNVITAINVSNVDIATSTAGDLSVFFDSVADNLTEGRTTGDCWIVRGDR